MLSEWSSMIHDTQSAQISQKQYERNIYVDIYIYIYIYIYYIYTYYFISHIYIDIPIPENCRPVPTDEGVATPTLFLKSYFSSENPLLCHSPRHPTGPGIPRIPSVGLNCKFFCLMRKCKKKGSS